MRPPPARVRTVPAADAIVLETAGPPPPDTIGDLRRRPAPRHRAPPRPAGERRLRRARPFPPRRSPSGGGQVRVEVRPRPGRLRARRRRHLPLRDSATGHLQVRRATSPPRRGRAPRTARDVVYERALAVGQLMPGDLIALLPSTRPAPDILGAACRPPGPTSWPRRRDRHLRRFAAQARRGGDGAGDPPGGARRRHAGDRVRQAAPRAVRLPAGIARGRRAVGALHLPRHRPARGVPLPRPALRALDARSRLDRRRDRRRAAGAPGSDHAPAPAGRGARAAPVHRRRGRVSGLRHRAHDRVAARRAARTTATCPTPS